MPRNLPEVRISRRVLTGLYIIFVVGLCVCTVVGVVSSLRAQSSGTAGLPPLEGPPRAPDARALTELRTLLEDLRSRGENVGRSNLAEPINVARWEEWTVRWRDRMNRLGAKYGLDARGDREGGLARSLQGAFRGTLSLLGAYDLATKNLAFARKALLEGTLKDLERAREALP